MYDHMKFKTFIEIMVTSLPPQVSSHMSSYFVTILMCELDVLNKFLRVLRLFDCCFDVLSIFILQENNKNSCACVEHYKSIFLRNTEILDAKGSVHRKTVKGKILLRRSLPYANFFFNYYIAESTNLVILGGLHVLKFYSTIQQRLQTKCDELWF